MRRAPKPKRPKDVSYTLIPPASDIGAPMYAQLHALVEAHHSDLIHARIALAWCTSWKADVDGRVILGKCKKATELDRELAPYDFVILLSKGFWLNLHVSTLQKTALLDHELCHAAVSYDENGDEKTDERGRTIYRVRKHDLEEFADIAARYGCWKGDLEAFAAALARAQASTTWIGYQHLRDQLQAINIDAPIEQLMTWSARERHDASVYLQMRREFPNQTAEMPAHVEALRPVSV